MRNDEQSQHTLGVSVSTQSAAAIFSVFFLPIIHVIGQLAIAVDIQLKVIKG